MASNQQEDEKRIEQIEEDIEKLEDAIEVLKKNKHRMTMPGSISDVRKGIATLNWLKGLLEEKLERTKE